MADPQFQPENLPSSQPAAVYVPVTAEDVARQKRKVAAMIAIGVIVAMAAGWYIYRRMVDPVQAQQAYADGIGLFKANRYEQAILNFTRAVDLKPDFAEAYRMRGRAYAAIDKPDDAIPDFTKVSLLSPKDGSVLIERGFAYLDKKDLTHAMADASGALAIDSKLARAYNLRATVERAVGETRKALDDFSRAVELAPNLDNYFQRAATYQMLNDHARAVADFDEALLLSPDQAHTYYARAQSRAALGDTQGAQEDIRAGRKIDGW
jgi:tetratricopeptide (TPR) repeat protein